MRGWVALAVFAGQAYAATDGGVDCEVERIRPTVAALEAAAARCGDGFGLYSALGVVQASRGDFDAAGESFVRELSAPDARWAAVNGLAQVWVRLSPTVQEKAKALGTGPDGRLYVPGYNGLSVLIDEVFCRGGVPVSVHSRFNLQAKAWVLALECPAGKRFEKYVRFDSKLDPPIQAGPRRAVDRMIVLGELPTLFGINDAFELREELRRPIAADRSQAWILGRMSDSPREKAVWAALLKQEPNDLEAVLGLARTQEVLGDLQGALATLRAANADRVRVVDTRSAASPSALFSTQCDLLRRLNRLPEAAAACVKAIERGSKVSGPLNYAFVLYLQGKLELALQQADASVEQEARNREGIFLSWLINRELKRDEAAQKRFAGSWGLPQALHVQATDQRSRAAWVALLDRDELEATAASFADCGHLYLDLEMTAQSDACFARAKKLDPVRVELARLEHLAETDPRTASRGLEAMLQKSRDVDTLLVAARAFAAADDHPRAVAALHEALYMLAPWQLPDELVATVCGAEALPLCLKAAPTPLP